MITCGRPPNVTTRITRRHRDRRAAGEQEKGLQDRVVRQREGELEAAGPGGRLGYLRRDECVDEGLGHRDGLDRAGQQREVQRASHCALRAGPRRRPGSRSSCPACAVSSSGSVAPLASQIIQYSDRVAEEAGGEVIQPVAVGDDVGLGGGVGGGLGDDAPGQVHDGRAVRQGELLGLRTVVAAAGVRRAAASRRLM